MEEYYNSKDESTRRKYESLYRQALELPKPSAAIYSACATAANLLNEPNEAIALLKKAIGEYPDEHVWGPKVPLKVSGYYRIGSIASRINDANEAAKAYESALKNCQNIQSSELYQILSLMHLFDIASSQLKDKQLAIKRLNAIKEIFKTVDKTIKQPGSPDSLIFVRSWVSYEEELLETGKENPGEKSDLNKSEYTLPFIVSMMHITLSQPSTPEMELAANQNNSSVEVILNKFAIAFACIHDLDYTRQLNDNVPKTEKYLTDIAESECYFKPYAEVLLDIFHEKVKALENSSL